MFRLLRQEFGLTTADIGALTPAVVRHQYLTPHTEDDSELDLGAAAEDPLVARIMARGYTRRQALARAAEVRAKNPPKKKTSDPGAPRKKPRPRPDPR